MNEVWKTAGFRAVVTAVTTGLLAALGVWSQTDDVKTIAIAGLIPFLTIIAARFGIEGAVDSQRATE
jgi:hypothetical protein